MNIADNYKKVQDNIAEAAVKAGVEAASAIGKVTAQNVMKRPVPPIGDVVSVHDVDF